MNKQSNLGKSERYVIVTCRSAKTMTIARLLFSQYDIRAWAPYRVVRNPGPKEKRIKPVLPGFVFISEQDYKEAEKKQKRLDVPHFTPLVVNSQIKTCELQELLEMKQAIDEAWHDRKMPEIDIKVGDEKTITQGPLKGIEGTVCEVYLSNTLMVKIVPSFCSAIELPAAFLA